MSFLANLIKWRVARTSTDASGNTVLVGADAVYVAVPTASANTAAAIQAAHDSLPVSGGIIQLGAGVYALDTTTLVFSKPIKLIGAGGRVIGDASSAPVAITTLTYSGSTGTAISITSAGCTLEDFLLYNTSASAPTVGVGLDVSTLCNMCALNRVSIVGFYNNAVFKGQYYTLTDCFILDYVNYGLLLQAPNVSYGDHGDQSITGTTLTSYFKTYNAVAACRWEGGGGLRFTNNKINGGVQIGNPSAGKQQVGLDIAVASGNGNTGVFIINNNSLENCTTACLRVRPQVNNATDILEKINIVGNEFLAAAGANCILAGASTSAGYNQTRALVIEGNTFSGGSAPVKITHCNNVSIGHNSYDYSAGLTAIDLSGYILNAYVDTASQAFGTDSSVVVLNDTRRLNADLGGAMLGRSDYQASHRVYITAAATPYTVGYVTLASDVGGAATIEVEIDAVEVDSTNAHIGTIVGRYTRTLTCAAGVSAVTATTIGTDLNAVTGTAAFSVAFDTSTAGKCAVTVSMTTATHKIFGTAKIKAGGLIQKLAIG